MGAPSLLFPPGKQARDPGRAGRLADEAAHDLRLDELARAMAAGRDGFGLDELLLTALPSAEHVAWRQSVFRDLASGAIADLLRAFERSMRDVRSARARAARLRAGHERTRWELAALEAYVAGVDALGDGLRDVVPEPASEAVRGVAAWLDSYRKGAEPGRLRADASASVGMLAGVTYRLRIGEHRIAVDRVRNEPDLGSEVREAFARFGGTPIAGNRPPQSPAAVDLDAIETAILDRVARLHPAAFTAADACVAAHRTFVDPALAALERESAFYLAWLDLVAPLVAAGLTLVEPAVGGPGNGALQVAGLYDIALALDLVAGGRAVVGNDIDVAASDRLLVATGPSQGGKTTLARALGQVHHLAATGCPVPAASAVVPLVVAIHTLFDRGEDPELGGGRLESDLRAIAAILPSTGPSTLVVMNETFPSTTVADALDLAGAVLDDLAARDARTVVVTFLDELARRPGAVSLACAVDPAEPERRTYRFERRPADGLAFAHAVAERHGLGYGAIRRRLDR